MPRIFPSPFPFDLENEPGRKAERKVYNAFKEQLSPELLYVGLTRAKAHLIVVGDDRVIEAVKGSSEIRCDVIRRIRMIIVKTQ